MQRAYFYNPRPAPGSHTHKDFNLNGLFSMSYGRSSTGVVYRGKIFFARALIFTGSDALPDDGQSLF